MGRDQGDSKSKKSKPLLKAVPDGDAKRIDGEQMAAEMLAGLDPLHREKLLASIMAKDPELGARLKGKMFGFASLEKLTDESFALLVRSIPISLFALAMRQPSEAIAEKTKRSLTARAQAALEEEKQAIGPKRVSEVKAAQQKVADLALEMLGEGKLELTLET